MFLVSTSDIAGKDIYQTLGLVKGNTIRAKNVFRDIVAGLKSIVGGELKDYTQMMTDAREQAIDRMTKDAEDLGANAIVNIRFASSDIMSTASETLVYGTAVKIK